MADPLYDLEKRDPRIKFMILEEQGQCKAVNAAIATCNTPWFFITNDDMVYPPGWFEKLTKPLPTGSQPLAVCPKLIEPRPGAPLFDVYFCGGAGGDFDKQKFLNYAKSMEDIIAPVEGYFRTGFNFPLLINYNLWNLVGGYDVNYDPWGSNSDSDLEYKIILAGIQPMQNSECLVYHFSQTSGTFEPKNDSFRHRNYAYFKEIWGFERTDNGIWEASFPIPTKEEGRTFLPWWENFFLGCRHDKKYIIDENGKRCFVCGAYIKI